MTKTKIKIKKETWKVGRSANGAPTVESDKDGMLCIAVFGLHRSFAEAHRNAALMARSKQMLEELRRIQNVAQGGLDAFESHELIEQIEKVIEGLD